MDNTPPIILDTNPHTPCGRCVARYRVLHYKYGISRREAWLIARYLERLCGTVT